MDKPIGPALTPEEWAEGVIERGALMVHLHHDDPEKVTVYIADAIEEVEEDGARFTSDAGETIGPDACRAAAALLLQRAGAGGTPLITHEQVAALRSTAEGLFETADLYGPGGAQALRETADLIESLLPPK